MNINAQKRAKILQIIYKSEGKWLLWRLPKDKTRY